MVNDLEKPNYERLGPPVGARVVITGGCGGIGIALVNACLDLGLKVAVLDLKASIEARDLPESVLAVPIDVHDEATVVKGFNRVQEAWGGAESVVNLIGYTSDLIPVEEMSAPALDNLISGNLRGMVLCCREAMRLLRAQGSGSIVNMSTGIAALGNPGYVGYAASKAGINALTRTLAAEAAPDIRVNGIAPGGVDTAFIRGGFGIGGREDGPPARIDLERYKAMVPLGRIGVADDIVGPILFLLSGAARYITGQTIHVNGGALMRD